MTTVTQHPLLDTAITLTAPGTPAYACSDVAAEDLWPLPPPGTTRPAASPAEVAALSGPS